MDNVLEQISVSPDLWLNALYKFMFAKSLMNAIRERINENVVLTYVSKHVFLNKHLLFKHQYNSDPHERVIIINLDVSMGILLAIKTRKQGQLKGKSSYRSL